MTYVILVWRPIIEKKYAVRRVENIHRAASICIGGALKITLSQALKVILYEKPTELVCKQLAAKSTLRLKKSSL